MLQGLGEPLNETRQFVKDLQFRNALERQQGELELLRQRLALARELGLLDTPEAREAAVSAIFAARRRRSPFSRRPRLELEPGEPEDA